MSDEGGKGGEDDITEPRCGDRKIALLHETCDDGNTRSGDGCSSACLIEMAVTVHLKIQNSAGEPQPCPVGSDTVVVTRVTTRFTGGSISFPCKNCQAHLEWLEEPRVYTSALQLQLTSSISHKVFGKTGVVLHEGPVRLDDVTATLIID